MDSNRSLLGPGNPGLAAGPQGRRHQPGPSINKHKHLDSGHLDSAGRRHVDKHSDKRGRDGRSARRSARAFRKALRKAFRKAFCKADDDDSRVCWIVYSRIPTKLRANLLEPLLLGGRRQALRIRKHIKRIKVHARPAVSQYSRAFEAFALHYRPSDYPAVKISPPPLRGPGKAQ